MLEFTLVFAVLSLILFWLYFRPKTDNSVLEAAVRYSFLVLAIVSIFLMFGSAFVGELAVTETITNVYANVSQVTNSTQCSQGYVTADGACDSGLTFVVNKIERANVPVLDTTVKQQIINFSANQEEFINLVFQLMAMLGLMLVISVVLAIIVKVVLGLWDSWNKGRKVKFE